MAGGESRSAPDTPTTSPDITSPEVSGTCSINFWNACKISIKMCGRCCRSFGRAVDSKSRGVYGSNPVLSKILYWTFTLTCIEKTKIKKKRPGIAHLNLNCSRGSRQSSVDLFAAIILQPEVQSRRITSTLFQFLQEKDVNWNKKRPGFHHF